MCPRSATGPAERFPVGAVEAILRDVLRGYLREQPYEPGTCREMAKTIAEVPPCFIRSGGRGVLLLLQGGLGGGPTVRSRLHSSSLVGNEASIPLPVPFLVAVNAKLEVLGFFFPAAHLSLVTTGRARVVGTIRGQYRRKANAGGGLKMHQGLVWSRSRAIA